MSDSLDGVNADSGNETDEKLGKSIECSSDICDEFLDSEDFQFDLGDTNHTGSDENLPHNLSSCTDDIVKSLDSISFSSVEHGSSNVHEPPDIEDEHFVHVSDEIQFIESPDNTDKSDMNSDRKSTDTLQDNGNNVPEGDIGNSVDMCIGDVCEDETIPVGIPNGIATTILSNDFKRSPSTKHTAYSKKKLKKILLALENGDNDFLRHAAISRGGLLNDEIRKKVWPRLVGVDMIETSPRPTLKEIEAHPYYQQVVLDVNRSLKRFPPSIKEAQRLTMLDQLVFLIMRVLCRHPDFHYYQGYHDICITFLLVSGEETAYHIVEKLSRTHLNVFMNKSMEPTIRLLEYMYVLIGKKNVPLKEFLLKSEVGVAYCLSWLITWFGHVLDDYDTVVRLYDFFIVSDPWMPMYLTTAIVLHRELEILKQDCEMAAVHSLLSGIPRDLPFEEMIIHSLNLYESYKPKLLARMTIEHSCLEKSKLKPKKVWTVLQTVSRKITSAVPARTITVPVVIAAAVLVTAILYQAYKY
ncbi:TBC1 domain family member 20 [Trichonephila clavata]|uniref:TBC1 domain family member 20 n=1 Tax=Trichonephila clavata TaxID=2740835 RepID=A0A8X6J9P9_TRICU|nr:TBC1 domain family member 20 [Trichonephila clavata]